MGLDSVSQPITGKKTTEVKVVAFLQHLQPANRVKTTYKARERPSAHARPWTQTMDCFAPLAMTGI